MKSSITVFQKVIYLLIFQKDSVITEIKKETGLDIALLDEL